MNGFPQLKKTILKYRNNNSTLLRVNGELAEIDDENGIIWNLLEKMDGTREHEDIVKLVSSESPSVDDKTIAAYIEQFKSLGFIEDASLSSENILNDYEKERWSRNIEFFGSISSYGNNKFEYQKKIRDSKVCLLGCGGLGTHILLDLAAIGFNNITIVDFDKIELSNLNRQILYKEEDIAKIKVHQAKKRICDFNSSININAIETRIDSQEKIESIIDGHDIVICVADKPRNYLIDWLNAACVNKNIPYINGGLDVRRAIFYSVIPNESGCVECWKKSLAEHNEAAASVIDLDKKLDIDYDIPAPAMVTLVAVTAGCMVSEALKIITGIQPPELTNKLKEFRFDDINISTCEKWERHQNCHICKNK
ncbi:HesA/MoeB/ThiF family protein [Vibrio mangrovi]|uniref:Molybdopterin-synthase adenylyltransferase n=1 Tax=Vibrio mangrovi TaxID=474394 RepID=A0A1Y6IXN9_9VIBR|nr:ThiF family adenylyltransferase [Vibrio mangrovi]MDW6002245.1 ThiF family adenylyltransferase [Vibrio mangrovi]SMS01590.1 Molybdopterin-synthase adenylyltransferase [Vibrio mangrovi]